jgi:cysteinyl-tRNA synthetase
MFEDLLKRALLFFGFNVDHVMNLTDVDDKTIKGAIAGNVTLNEFTAKYIDAFFEDVKTLNIMPADHYPKATEYFHEMIQMIEKLIQKGIAYKGGDGSIYYNIRKFPRYGCLSHFKLEELQTGASERVAADEYEKDNISDFVLWKAYDSQRDGQIYWESPFGPGRPGWHIECSAMAMKLLGDTIDIHCGGVDNMFPHHENEIAQSEACSGKPFARFWMHAEHLVVDNKKMSKSLGNFYTLRDLLQKGYTGLEVRYMLLQTHYKTQLNFTMQGLDASRNAVKRLNEFVQRLLSYEANSYDDDIESLIHRAHEAFKTGLSDDLNISVAIASLFDFMREVNGLIDKALISEKSVKQIIELLKKFDSVLGVLNFEKATAEIPQELEKALQERIIARMNKDWKQSDLLRDYIYSKGYVIEDTPSGAKLKKA